MKDEEVIKCHKGWKYIYDPIVKAICQHDRNLRDITRKIGVKSVTNKFGCLDIQVYNSDNLYPRLLEMIHYAHIDSERTCEFCGTLQNVGHTLNDFRYTCCQSCYEKEVKPHGSLAIKWEINEETNYD